MEEWRQLHAFFTLTLGGVSGLLFTSVASHQEKNLVLVGTGMGFYAGLDMRRPVLTLLGIEPQFLSCPACSLVTLARTVAN